MQEEDVVASDVVTHLARGLQEGLRFDVAYSAAHLVNDDVVIGTCHTEHALLDGVGDVRDHLNAFPEVVTAAFGLDHGRIDLTGRDVGLGAQIAIEEAFVVADVEIGFGAVIGNEHLAVLERIHRSGIDVEIGVELLHGHPQSAGHQQTAETGRRQALSQ